MKKELINKQHIYLLSKYKNHKNGNCSIIDFRSGHNKEIPSLFTGRNLEPMTTDFIIYPLSHHFLSTLPSLPSLISTSQNSMESTKFPVQRYFCIIRIYKISCSLFLSCNIHSTSSNILIFCSYILSQCFYFSLLTHPQYFFLLLYPFGHFGIRCIYNSHYMHYLPSNINNTFSSTLTFCNCIFEWWYC